MNASYSRTLRLDLRADVLIIGGGLAGTWAAVAGAELSGMEFSNYYGIAAAGTNMSRSMVYTFGDYFDAADRPLPMSQGPGFNRRDSSWDEWANDPRHANEHWRMDGIFALARAGK